VENFAPSFRNPYQMRIDRRVRGPRPANHRTLGGAGWIVHHGVLFAAYVNTFGGYVIGLSDIPAPARNRASPLFVARLPSNSRDPASPMRSHYNEVAGIDFCQLKLSRSAASLMGNAAFILQVVRIVAWVELHCRRRGTM